MIANNLASLVKGPNSNSNSKKETSAPITGKPDNAQAKWNFEDNSNVDFNYQQFEDLIDPKEPDEMSRSRNFYQDQMEPQNRMQEGEFYAQPRRNKFQHQSDNFDSRQRSRDMSIEGTRQYGMRDASQTRNSGTRGNPMSKLTGQEQVVLMVAEKPSIARSIAMALSNGRFGQRKGIATPVLEYPGEIFGQPALFRVTSVTGHIYCRDFPVEYQDWKQTDPLSLFQASTIKKETNPEQNIIQHLQTEATGVTYLVLWLDFDREGENICFEVMENVQECMKKEDFRQIYRAKFSSIVDQDIRRAFNSLKDEPNLNESLAVDARQEIDLKIGVAFSRFQTLYLQRRFEVNAKLISYGPCQTPALGFCVDRDDEIKNFVSQTFYRVIPTVTLPNGESCDLNWAADRTLDPEEAMQIREEILEVGRVTVIESKNKESRRERPEALNTVQMLKIASSVFGYGPNAASSLAEKLYLRGYITYPRTESTSYPKNFDHNEIVHALSRTPPFSEYAGRLLQGGLNKPKNGKDAGDHPPISPTLKVPMRERIEPDEWKFYEFITRHYLATVSPDAKFQKKNVVLKAGKHEFTVTGTAPTSKGFTEITPWVKIYDNYIPNFQQGEIHHLSNVEVKTGKTTPPDHLTESALMSLMEQNGIGTDASMAQHINNICERNYVEVVGKARKLVPKELGSSLIHVYKMIDPELSAPDFRMHIEQSVDKIAKGLANHEEVLNEVLTIFAEKFAYFRNHAREFDSIFSNYFPTRMRPDRQNFQNNQQQQDPKQRFYVENQGTGRSGFDNQRFREKSANSHYQKNGAPYQQKNQSEQFFDGNQTQSGYSNSKREFAGQNQRNNEMNTFGGNNQARPPFGNVRREASNANQEYTGKFAPNESFKPKNAQNSYANTRAVNQENHSAYSVEYHEGQTKGKENLASNSKKIKKFGSPTGPLNNNVKYIKK